MIIRKAADKKKSENGFFYWSIRVLTPDRRPDRIDWDSPLLAADDDESTTTEPVSDVPPDMDGLNVKRDASVIKEDDQNVPF